MVANCNLILSGGKVLSDYIHRQRLHEEWLLREERAQEAFRIKKEKEEAARKRQEEEEVICFAYMIANPLDSEHRKIIYEVGWVERDLLPISNFESTT